MHHYLPKEHHESLHYIPEIVVPFNSRVWIQSNVPKELHADNGIDEEEHDHQHHDVGQSLDGLDEGEEQDANADAASEQLDQSGRAKQPKEAHVDHLGGVDDAANHGDEVERVPGVFEIRLHEESKWIKSIGYQI